MICCRKYLIVVCFVLITLLIWIQLVCKCLRACETSLQVCSDNPVFTLNVLTLGLHRSLMMWIDTAPNCVERDGKLLILVHLKPKLSKFCFPASLNAGGMERMISVVKGPWKFYLDPM